ncbi:choline transporter-like protein 2 [Biomphalaria pfeifferi]|uniref:Choline transporter-like protein n=1 Tax=Biomphalaria pfeifferi TaxID=112525 RepID=A0AAD8C391_BIOPF|nr:choline transporter-like protein 2 [Biomphalaria pfeifferi]
MAKKQHTEGNGGTFTDIKGKKGASSSSNDTPLKKGYDPSRQGPKRKRSCTDVICCLIFIIFLGGLVVVAYFAFMYGDPQLLIYPRDSNGNLCGLGKYENKKYLFFFDLVECGRVGPGVFLTGCPTPQVCVAKCPDTDYIFAEDLVTQNKSKLICKDGVETSKKRVDQLVFDKDCAAYYFESKAVINRCLPITKILDLGKDIVNIAGKNHTIVNNDNKTLDGGDINYGIKVFEAFLKAKEIGDKIIADVVASWWMMLIGLVVAMVISMIWIVLMRWISGFMVWLTVLLFVALWLALTICCWYLYFQNKGTNETLTVYLIWQLSFEKENLFLAGGIIFGVIFVIVFFIMLFLCQRIRIAVALIGHGSRAVGSMWSTLFWPLVPFVLQLGVVALWGCIATFLLTIGRAPQTSGNFTLANGTTDIAKYKSDVENLFERIPCKSSQNDTEGKLCGFLKYGKGDYTIYLQIFNLFMFFWLVNFVSALGQLTLSGAFSSYYWAFDKSKDIPALPLLGAFYRCFRYHLGSLAFGSLLIAIVQIIRAFLEYLDSKLKASENPVAKFFLKCLKCCFWCLEKILKFLCKNAYIMIAVYGKNFCTSAKRAFELILKNCVRAFVLDKVTDFLFFVCKLMVVGAVGVIAYFFFDGKITFLNQYTPMLNFYFVPIIVVVIGAYIIADLFFSVYEMAVDTIFLCFLDDIERNDGSPEKPYFMGKDLMKLLGKKNLKPKTEG